MNKNTENTEKRGKRVSPELAEVLHMLASLESRSLSEAKAVQQS